jgi:hypothetical protein
MAHKLYFDNKKTHTLTADDKASTFDSGSALFVLADDGSDYITNEARVTDRSIATAVSNMGANDALLFDFGESKTIDFIAVYVASDTSTNIQVLTSAATTGNTTSTSLITTDLTTGWNFFEFTAASSRYWTLRASGSFAPTEVYFGEVYNIGSLDIKITKPFNSFVASSYDNTEYSNKIDTELRTWEINIPLVTDSDKSLLELLISDYANLHKFVYYDESSYHNVRLIKAPSFNQVATNAFSTSLTLKEESSA